MNITPEFPVGSVIMYLGTAEGAQARLVEVGDKWLPLDGRSVLKERYPQLAEILYALDYDPNQNEPFMVLPDARQKIPQATGSFIVGDFGGDVDHTHGSHSTHATDGAHTHDAHTSTTSQAGANTAVQNPATHSSDGGHTHDAHSAHTTANPAFIAVHLLIKALP